MKGSANKNKFSCFVESLFKLIIAGQERFQITYLIIISLSGVWFSLILVFFDAPFVEVVDGSRKLTPVGWVCTVLLFLLVTLGEIAKLKAKKEEPQEIFGFKVLSKLRRSVFSISESKYKTLLDCIQNTKAKNISTPPLIISDPPKQLDSIAMEISNCISYLLYTGSKFSTRDLAVSIVCAFPEEDNQWFWVTEECGLSLSQLIKTNGRTKQPISTLQYTLQNHGNSFFNSKAEAEEAGLYLPDDLDKRDAYGNLLGSIACYKFEIKKGDITYIKFVVMLSTYSRPFTVNPDQIDNIKDNIKQFILSDFLIQIKTELCLLYLQHLNEHICDTERL